MKLTFKGTRGNIKIRTELHFMHTSLEVRFRGKRLLIDFGEDWLPHAADLHVDAIVLTHGHPDHAWGLKRGAPCPVYATEATWKVISEFEIRDRHIMQPGRAFRIAGFSVEAFAVEHSIRCPAVGFRVTAGKKSFFYAPDIVAIVDRSAALSQVQLYIGDGATIERSLVRRSGEYVIGHTPIRTQIGWCEKEAVPQAIFTHCGTEIVSSDPAESLARVAALGEERNVQASIAWDGLEIDL
ncbi:MBL fold metallo-hydrolase [Desulfomonile tiedjei]|nr:MBL fold metallo-hydrolase [Desulfomonile tiedjei]